MRPVIVPFFISHQGCPHRCVFCDQEKISSGTYPLPTREELLGKIISFSETAGSRPIEVAFYGGSFTALARETQESLLEPLQPLLRDGRIRGIRISTRPDAVTAETAQYLRSSGVKVVELGVQSLDDEVLRRAGRGHTAVDVASAATFLKGEGLRLGLQLMVGLPGDSDEISISTTARALEMAPDFLRIYPTLVIAGTELDRLYRAGEYAPLSLADAVSRCSAMQRLARQRRVPIVRMGIQPTGDLEASGSVVAGPYHPAFRQLVESEAWYTLLRSLAHGMTGAVTVRCPPSRISDVTGQRRSNLLRLLAECSVIVDSVEADPLLAPYELVVNSRSEKKRGSITDSPMEVF